MENLITPLVLPLWQYILTMVKFGEWLIRELEERRISQTDLAQSIHVTPAQVSRIISGDRRPSNEVLEKIAHFLKLPIQSVFNKAGILPPQTEDNEMIAEIKHLMADLPTDEQEGILEYTKLRHRIVEEREKLNASKRNRTRPAPSTHS